VDGLVANEAFIADFHPKRVEEDQRVDRFQGSHLPGGDLVEYGIGYGADQISRDLDAIEIAQVPRDLPLSSCRARTSR
jgi:hypothetical protein